MRARLNGVPVFLSEDNPPGFSTSLNDLLDPTKVKGLDSTTVEVISTPEARRALGGDGMQELVRTRGNILRMGNDDRDHFNAECIPVRWDREKIEGYCVGGNAAWFDYAKDNSLQDVDLGTIAVSKANMEASWDTRPLVYWPLVDHGAFEGQTPGSYDVSLLQMRPALNIAKLMQGAMAPEGWTLKFRGRTLEQLDRAYLKSSSAPDCVSEQDTIVQRDNSLGTGELGIVEAIGSTPDKIETVSSNENTPNWDNFNAPFFTYVVPNTGIIRFTEDTTFWVRENAPGQWSVGDEFHFVIWNDTLGQVVADIPYVVTGTEVEYPNTSMVMEKFLEIRGRFNDLFVVQGDELYFGLTSSIGGGLVIMGMVRPVQVPVPHSAVCVFKVFGGQYTIDREMRIASVAPPGTIAEFMAAVAKWASLVYYTDTVNKVIEVWYEKDYFKRPAKGVKFRDWSDRIDYTQAPAKLNDQAPRSLHYRFREERNDRSLQLSNRITGLPGYGNINADVPRGYANELRIELPYAATAMDRMHGEDGGFQIPVIRIEDHIGEDQFSHAPRLLMHGGLRDGNWTFDGDAKTSYPWSYFVSDRPTDLPAHFGNPLYYGGQQPSVIDLYGQQRLRRMRDCLLLECRMRIYDHELIDFDHGKPTLVKYKGVPTWFWVHEVKNHVFGQHGTTEVLLVEIPGAEVSYERPAQTQVTFPEVIPAPEVTIVQTNNCIEGEFTLTATFNTPSNISNFEIIVNGGSLTYLNNPTSPTDLGTYNTVDDTVEIQMTYGPGPGGQYPVVSLGEWDGTGGSACAGGPCGGPYMRVRSATGVMSIGNTRTSTGYITLKNELGQVTLGNGVPGTFITGAMTSVGEECNVCIYSSDVNGNASGNITYLTIAGQDLIEVQDMGDDTDALLTLNLSGNDLDSNSVDLVLNGLDASLAAGLVDLSGGTNSAPTGASFAAVTALNGNGWTVNTN